MVVEGKELTVESEVYAGCGMGMDAKMLNDKKEEVGYLHIYRVCDATFQIERFAVKEKYRGKGIGSELLNTLQKKVKKYGGKKIIVYPNSEPYEGECYIERRELYEIYGKLGFRFIDSDVDVEKSNCCMVKILA